MMTLRVSYTNTFSGTPGVDADIEIISRSVTETAPEGIVFEIINLSGFDTSGPTGGNEYDPQLHELDYYWDFDDSYNFVAPQNLHSGFLNAGVAYGPKVTHVFRAPGTYNVSCLIHEKSSGKTTTENLSVTVGDPASNYTGTNTIFVDTTGVGTNAPVGATVVSTIDAATDLAYADGNNNAHRRVMLENGQTFAMSSPEVFGWSNARSHVFFCARDPNGTKPIIDTTAAAISWIGSGATVDCDLRFQDVRFEGPWNTLTQSGASQTCFTIQQNRPKQTLFDRCEFDGYQFAIYPQDNSVISANSALIFNDGLITNWRSSGIYTAENNIIISCTGSRLMQDVDALNGFGTNSSDVIGPARIAAAPTVIWTQNDHFNRVGWVFNNGRYDNQGCFRGNTAGTRGAFYNINCNTMEGGFRILQFDSSDVLGGATSPEINALVFQNYLLGNHNTNIMVRSDFGGVSIFSNVFVYSAAARYSGDGFSSFFWLAGDVPNAETLAAPIKIYSNTCVNMSDVANPGGAIPLLDDAFNHGFTTIVENNVDLQPNRGGNPLTNIDSTTTLFTPRYTHYEHTSAPPSESPTTVARDTSVATPTNAAALFRQTVERNDYVSGNLAHRDFYGAVRPTSNPDQGAFEGVA